MSEAQSPDNSNFDGTKIGGAMANHSTTSPNASAQTIDASPQIVTVPVVTTVPPAGIDTPIPTNVQQPVSKPQKKKGNRLLIAEIAICLLAIIALIATLALLHFKPFGLFQDPAPSAPSSYEVEQAFSTATIPDPDLRSYKYIKRDGFKSVELSEFSASEVQSNDNNTWKCTGSATASEENESVSVEETLSMTMNYTNGNWQGSTPTIGSMSVTPLAPAELKEIEGDIQNILRAYDSEAAALFINATVTSEASLTTSGGTIVFHLSKDDNGTTRECTLNCDVSWKDDTGWNVEVKSATGLDDEGTPTDTSTENQTPSQSDTSDVSQSLQPTMLLQCYSGDLVQVPGVIQIQNNGTILLKTDDVIRVEFNDRVYITTYFEIRGVGSLTNGRHMIISGAISANGNLPEAPLVINMDYE